MPKETLWSKPTERKENRVREVFEWLSDEQKNEMFNLLNQERIRDGLLENLDENNCCDKLLEAYKSFAGSEVEKYHALWWTINHPFFIPEYSFPILLGDRDKIYNLGTLTMDDIVVCVSTSYGRREPIKLSRIDSGIGRKWKPIPREYLDKAKRIIIKFLKKYLNWEK